MADKTGTIAIIQEHKIFKWHEIQATGEKCW